MAQDCWDHLTDPVLLKIFYYLSAKDIVSAGTTCSNWNRISYDELLWRYQFRKHFNIKSTVDLKPGQKSWYEEFKRLTYHVPLVETEVLNSHTDSVLHVTFSHDGQYFVTCSMDGYVVLWNSTYPASMKRTYDMKKFSWKYTQYAEFNESDTLLLVSGVHFGKNEDTSGEIAVFSVEDEMALICRILNKPYDVFGTFYSEEYIFSGQVQQIANLICSSSIWIHKAFPDITSEHKPLMSRLFRFMNVNASFIRTLLVAKCKTDLMHVNKNDNKPSSSSGAGTSGNKPSYETYRNNFKSKSQSENASSENKPPWFLYNEEYKSVESISDNFSDPDWSKSDSACHSEISSENEEDFDTDTDEDLSAQPAKYLIFTTGSKTTSPHQIGIKRIGQIAFPKTLDPGPSLAERIAERRERAQRPAVSLDNINIDNLSRNFDSVDHLIELHGHIIGMKLSPDHRYLYVNCRPWPEGYVITNPLDPPPIAQEIDIHVIDLSTFKEVGIMLRAHRAYTPSDECFLIFLDVSNDYVASGSEDKHGYLWDRHYGIGLAKFPHENVVNCVAFNPKDSETLITVSDDNLIKIWRSRARTAELFPDISECPRAIKLSPKRKESDKKTTKNFRLII